MNTTTEAKATRRSPSALDVIETIEASALPAPAGRAIRTLGTAEQNKLIRGVFKAAGIKGVTVKRSHAGWSATCRVEYPRIAHDEDPVWHQHNRVQCAICLRNEAAQKKLHQIILAAFPDCGDKSDIQTDYFDYVFSVMGVG